MGCSWKGVMEEVNKRDPTLELDWSILAHDN